MRTPISNFELYDVGNLNGTALESIVVNKSNGRRGYLKSTGSMLGVPNDDINELVSSRIAKGLGLRAPEVELVNNNEQNSWVSYDVLNNNEVAYELEDLEELEISPSELKTMDRETIFKLYIDKIKKAVQELGEDYSETAFVELLQSLLLDCILENHDFKADNKKFAVDKDTGKIHGLMYYDFGVAFNKNSIQKHFIFNVLNSQEIMTFLIKNYYKELEEFINTILSTIDYNFMYEATCSSEISLPNAYSMINIVNLNIHKLEDYINLYVNKNEDTPPTL